MHHPGFSSLLRLALAGAIAAWLAGCASVAPPGAQASQPADLVYGMAKAMIVHYDLYKNDVPGADGLELKRQNLSWVIPYHEGTIRAMKESGVWTDATQKHNDALVKRQETLGKAWGDFLKGNPPEDKDAFAKGWMAKRNDALQQAGMESVFE